MAQVQETLSADQKQAETKTHPVGEVGEVVGRRGEAVGRGGGEPKRGGAVDTVRAGRAPRGRWPGSLLPWNQPRNQPRRQGACTLFRLAPWVFRYLWPSAFLADTVVNTPEGNLATLIFLFLPFSIF